MKKFIKTLAATLIAVAMILPFQTFSLAAGNSGYEDMPAAGYWSHDALEAAVENGLLTGYNGKLMPQEKLTRAELVATIVRAFGATAMADIGGYSDVTKADWFYGDIAKAVKMGVLEGSGGLIRPKDPVSRQETFAVLARAFKLSGGSAGVLNKFTDVDTLASWATDALASLVAAGYVQGTNGKLYPLNNISREEFAQILYRILQNYITSAGTYTTLDAGNVMINCDGVTLKGVTVSGDLIIGDGVGNGAVTLDHVTVTGRLVVRGGGENSIKIINQSNVGNIIVTKTTDGAIRVYCENGSRVDVVQIDDGSDKVIIEGTYNSVKVDCDTPIVLKNTDITHVIVNAASAKIEIQAGSTVTALDSAAPGVTIVGGGTLKAATVSGDNTSVNTSGTALTVTKGTKGVTENSKAVDASNGATITTGGGSSGGGAPSPGGGGPIPGGGTPTFTESTNSTTVNNDATLGLVGTAVTSSDSGIATAAISSGLIAITSKGSGDATITVSVGTHQATIPVSVSPTGAITIGTITKYVPPITFTESTNSTTVNNDATLGLVGTAVTSSDSGIATAAISGGLIAITSKGSGDATITVSVGTHQATIPVSVSPTGTITIGTITKYVPPITFTESTNSTTVNNDATLGLVGTAVTSSDSGIATAAISSGLIAITSKGSGDATITVSVGTHQATIPVSVSPTGTITIGTITKYVPPITFTESTNSTTVNNDATLGLVGTAVTSSDSGIATAAISSGLIAITSKGSGDATITVSVGTHQATIPVSVSPTGAITIGTITKYVPPISFTESTNSTTVNNDATLGLVGTAVTSSDSGIATAAISGSLIAITSKGSGDATITVSVGTHQATIPVSVSPTGAITIGTITKYVPPISFTESTNSTTVNNDATLGLVGTAVTSSDSGIATAAISGGLIVITSKGSGDATITVSVGTHQATIPVSVSPTGAITIGTITKYVASPISSVTTYDELTAALSDSSVTSINITGNFDITAKTTISKAITVAAGVTLNLKAPLDITSVLTVNGTIDINFTSGQLQIHGGTLAGSGKVMGGDVLISNIYRADGSITNGEISLTDVSKVSRSADVYGDIGLQNAISKGEKTLNLNFDGGTPFTGSNDITLLTDADLDALSVNSDVKLTITCGKSLKVSKCFLVSDLHSGNFAKLTIDTDCKLEVTGNLNIDPGINILLRGTLDNEGSIVTLSDLINPGAIHLEPSSTLLNNGTIVNHGQVTLHDWYPVSGSGSAATATVTNNGTIEFNGITYVANVYSEAQLSNAAAATFGGEHYSLTILRKDTALTNNLKLQSLLNVSPGIALTIAAGTTMTLEADGAIYNEGAVSVAGTLTVANSCYVYNLHTLQISGTLTNNGSIHTDLHSTLTNTGTIDNYGNILLHGGTFDNSAPTANVHIVTGIWDVTPGATVLDHYVIGWRGKDDLTGKPKLELDSAKSSALEIRLYFNYSIRAQLDTDGSTWTEIDPSGNVTIGPLTCPLATLSLVDSNADKKYDWFNIAYGAATGDGSIEIKYQATIGSTVVTIDYLMPVHVH